MALKIKLLKFHFKNANRYNGVVLVVNLKQYIINYHLINGFVLLQILPSNFKENILLIYSNLSRYPLQNAQIRQIQLDYALIKN